MVTTPHGVRAMLADGRVVQVRALQPADDDDVFALHGRLSEQDRYLRFFGAATVIYAPMVRRITRAPDAKHAALGVWSTSCLWDGVAGVTRFVAEVLAENRRMIQVFLDAGMVSRMSVDRPKRHVEISLDTDERFAAAVDERDRVADVASLATVLRPASIVVVGAGRSPGSATRCCAICSTAAMSER